jgi:hypothetical protein
MSKLNNHVLDVGPGWKDILYDLDKKLEKIVPDYEVTQVKEKYGALRIYLEYPSGYCDIAELELEYAEEASTKICEQCGCDGTLRHGTWMKTLCDTCHRLREERKAS